jgi:predicted regulator of Ras-like GTPase activity (Roadblock/LC7/MglB family)
MNTYDEQISFEQILVQMNEEGQFTAAILASDDGLLVAAAPTPSPYDAETVAAMVALVKDFIKQTQTRIGLAEVDEVSIVVGDRSRLICRYFNAGTHPLVLAILAPPNHSYRRLTTRAARDIQAAWQTSVH